MAELTYPLLAVSRHRMSVDGTGVTTLVAGALCPLSCRWCINQQILHRGKSKAVTARELYERVKCDDLYFRATGGGVTFGGGEALLHVPFFAEFRKLCPEWHLCVETSLAVPREAVEQATECIDEFIVDCKDMNADIYHRYTGGDGALMRGNLEFLLSAVGPERVTVRVPLIPEFNTKEDQARSAEQLRALGAEKLDLFEYVIREEMREESRPEKAD